MAALGNTKNVNALPWTSILDWSLPKETPRRRRIWTFTMMRMQSVILNNLRAIKSCKSVESMTLLNLKLK